MLLIFFRSLLFASLVALSDYILVCVFPNWVATCHYLSHHSCYIFKIDIVMDSIWNLQDWWRVGTVSKEKKKKRKKGETSASAYIN